ncbi:ferredoxin, partial [Nocardia niigatensis]
VAGVPFDESNGVIPNDKGRVLADGNPVRGVYVSGWIKRGPRGVIGSNRVDSQETVDQLIDDFTHGKLAAPQADRADLDALLAERQPDQVGRDGWKSIDATEKTAGKSAGRPRVKFTSIEDLLKAAKS